jgi:hypothetical protein
MATVDDQKNWLSGAAKSVGGAFGDAWDAFSGQTDYRPGLGQVNTGRIDQSRANSMGLQNQLALAAQGQGPSAAQAQLQAGTQAGLRQQLAMAASARGGAAQQAAARRQGMANAAMQTGQASNEAAALRAREQQAAQGLLSNLSLGQQQADLGIEQANLNALTSNQQQRMQIAQGNAAGKQSFLKDVASGVGAVTTFFSDVRGKESIQPMTGYEQAGQLAVRQALPPVGVAVNQATPAPQPQQSPPPSAAGGIGAFLTALSDERSKEEIRSLRSQLDAVTREADAMRASPPATGDVSASLRQLATPEGSRQGLAPVEPYQYRYKPEAAAAYGEDTAPRAGVMAQELEQSPYLRSAVVQSPDGTLGIDASRGLSASLAAAAGLDKRQRQTEGAAAELDARMRDIEARQTALGVLSAQDEDRLRGGPAVRDLRAALQTVAPRGGQPRAAY